jgi:hypothetical protein
VDDRDKPGHDGRPETSHPTVVSSELNASFLLRELDIFRMAADGASPDGAALMITVSLACIFAVGAGIMGYSFLLSDDES